MAYLRNGAFVTIAQLLLAAGPRVSIVDDSFSKVSIDPTDAFAGYRLHSDGTIDGTAGTTLNWALDRGLWLLSGINSNYEARATLNTGALDAGSSVTGSWLVLSTTRSWWCQITAGLNVQQANLTVEIRDAVSLAVLDTATIVLYAEVTA